jgi:hypothetical protein
VNGHVYPQVGSLDITAKYHEPGLLFLNHHDGTFKNISNLVGPASVHQDEKYLDDLNCRLSDALEKDGLVFLSGTKIYGKRVASGVQCQQSLKPGA